MDTGFSNEIVYPPSPVTWTHPRRLMQAIPYSATALFETYPFIFEPLIPASLSLSCQSLFMELLTVLSNYPVLQAAAA